MGKVIKGWEQRKANKYMELSSFAKKELQM